MKKNTNFFMVGCGGVCTALFEIFNKEKMYLKNHFTIIEPENIADFIIKSRPGKVKHIKKKLENYNIDILLKDVDKNSIIVDLSVDVDFLAVSKFAIKKKAMYVNTSLENWESYEEPYKRMPSKYNTFKEETLYYRQLLADKHLSKSKKTIVTDAGANPGSDSLLVLNFLFQYANDNNLYLGDYAEFARKIGIRDILFTEKDTQTTNIPPVDSVFINTWSPIGLMGEQQDHIMMSTNPNDPHVKPFIYPTSGSKNVMFLPRRGMDLMENSIVLDDKGDVTDIRGYLIPHNEINTLSRFLTYGYYTPRIYYIYEMSPIARKSMDLIRKNKYVPFDDYYVLKNNDIIDGYDSLGALIKFDNGREYWTGFIQTKENIDKLGFISGATVVQVASFINSTIKYMLDNPEMGYLTPEYLPLSVLHDASKYMGHFITKQIN